MKKWILLIRHGKTQGNLEGRYIGAKTDESLSEVGRKQLLSEKEKYAFFKKEGTGIYSSSMKRCQETTQTLFPDSEFTIVCDLTEIDFGEFENKNYKELNGDLEYQRWIDSNGRSDYPGGEALSTFIKRSMEGFHWMLEDMDRQNMHEAILVCHGGNIMAIMSSLTGKDYFDFQIDNTKGILIEIEEGDRVDCVSYSLI